MHKRAKAIILALTIFLTSGCNSPSTNERTDMPDDFNFSLSYGTYGKMKVDTFEGIVVKDLIEDGTIQAQITLTEEEKKAIYTRMMEIGIMNELDLKDLQTNSSCFTEPWSSTYWKIQMYEKTKEFGYTSNYCKHPEELILLYKLEDYIHKVITKKEEYKLLPESNGGYE